MLNKSIYHFTKRGQLLYTRQRRKKGNKNMKFIKKSIVENLIDYKYLKKKEVLKTNCIIMDLKRNIGNLLATLVLSI